MPEPKFEVQMLHDRVMIKADKDGERTSSSGIVIPVTADQSNRLAWGEVCGTGHTVRMVKTGDRVLFHPADQLEVELQGATYLVMRERDLHAVANERPEHGTGLYL
ncbi:co-chaperone GroES [Actinocorallia longicatena]|uniref:10 kDa chaperonin n=1 Tax=Actinocorallia longicatena TaxID=111803 RepID=A0ABP6QG80_9ACTN